MPDSISPVLAQDAEIAYNKDLSKAAKQDFSNLHGLIRCCCDDLAGHPVVLVQAERLIQLQAEAEHIFRYVIVKLDEVVDAPYSIICIHDHETNARAARMDNMLAMRSFYERYAVPWLIRVSACTGLAVITSLSICRLPVKYKLRLKKFFIVNPTNALRTLMAVLCPFYTHGVTVSCACLQVRCCKPFEDFVCAGFWNKVIYVYQSDTLWEHIEPVWLPCKLSWTLLT